jgi:hypothetical protein
MNDIPTTIKYYNDKGEVGVLVSPGYGAGWYSWNPDQPELLFDKDIVQAVLDGDKDKVEAVAEEKYGDSIYIGGASNLIVVWLKPGTLFRIDEYDGAESLITYSNDVWHKA